MGVRGPDVKNMKMVIMVDEGDHDGCITLGSSLNCERSETYMWYEMRFKKSASARYDNTRLFVTAGSSPKNREG